VLLNLGLSWWPHWHYAVLLGYDLDAQTVRLHTGRDAHAEWSMVTFENTWARSGHWAFVALPLGQLPVTADEAALTRALLGLDRALPAVRCVPAWTVARERWPDNLTLAMGEANALMASGQLPLAESALARLVDRSDSAIAWNNLAAVRLRLGERAGARAAAERAVQRARKTEPRWVEATEQTLRETESP
jgi:hypothetical protein